MNDVILYLHVTNEKKILIPNVQNRVPFWLRKKQYGKCVHIFISKHTNTCEILSVQWVFHDLLDPTMWCKAGKAGARRARQVQGEHWTA